MNWISILFLVLILILSIYISYLRNAFFVESSPLGQFRRDDVTKSVTLELDDECEVPEKRSFVGIMKVSEPLTTCELADYPGVYNQRYDFMMRGNIGVQGNIGVRGNIFA